MEICTENTDNELKNKENNIKKGSRKQLYDATHKEFLELWAEGLTELEIAQKLDLTHVQLVKHTLQAFNEDAPRKKPSYRTIAWEDLGATEKKLIPNGNGCLVKLKGDESGLRFIATLVNNSTAEENNA